MQELQYNPILRLAVGLTVVVIVALVIVHRAGLGTPKIRGVGYRMAFSSLMLVYALTAAELGLYFFYAQTSGAGGTLASRRWFQKYWQPINSYGYRDREHAQDELAGKKVLAVLGDSFVAGCGIADVSDRFSDLLADSLGSQWEVVNIAKPGWHTRAQYEALTEYPLVPDVVILSYFVNDIDGAAEANGMIRPATGFPKPRLLRSWINRSHLVNLAFSRWYAKTHGGTPDSYWRFLDEAYTSPQVWRTHAQEILDIIDFCELHDTKLLVLVIPNLRDVENSRLATSQVTSLLESHGVAYLDLTPRLANRDSADMVVNAFDAHANEALNREIADLLHQELSRRHFGVDAVASEMRVPQSPQANNRS